VLVAFVTVAPNLIQQLAATEHPAGMAGEMEQQVEFFGGQRQLLARQQRPALARLDHERATRDARIVRRCSSQPTQGFGSPQQRLHPGEQLRETERFDQIVVGAQLQAQHPVQLRRLGGQHQDRQVIVAGAQPLANRQPVQIGQHQVQNHQIVAMLGETRQGFLSAAGDIRHAVNIAEMQFDQSGDLAVVLDEQYLARHRV